MNFDPWICSSKIWESIGIPTLKLGAHLGVCGLISSHFPTFLWAWNEIPGLHSRVAPLQALILVASLRLGCDTNIVVSFYLVKKTHQNSQPNKPNQRRWIKINLSKMAIWSSWTWGQTCHMVFFWLFFSIKKIMISCNEKNQSKLIFKNYMLKEIFGNFVTIFLLLGFFLCECY
jgi:hypothetical protein